jgi:hypothetical protein
MIFNDTIVVLAADAPPGLFPAREQMAVSLGWHIILACFGVAFPMMIFVMYRRAIRRNDPTAFGSGEAVGWCAPACRPSMCPMNMLQPSWPPRQVNSNPASPSLGERPINRRTLSDAVRDTHGRLVTTEDHRLEGGARLGSARSPRRGGINPTSAGAPGSSCHTEIGHTYRTARGRRDRTRQVSNGPLPTPAGRHQRTIPWLRRARLDAAPLTGGPTVNRILHSLIGDPPTALETASKTTAPYVIPAVLFQPHIQRRLCWNDHHHETEHQ